MVTGTQIVWGIAIVLVGISLLNPGGLLIWGGLAVLLLLARYSIPFAGDVIRERQKGVSSAKADQKMRNKLRGGR